MRTLLLELRSQLETLTGGLSRVTIRRMFGCDAFLAGGAIFAMVWREGRIGLRLPDALLPDLRARRVMITHMNPTMLAHVDDAKAAGVLVAEDGAILPTSKIFL